MTVHPRLRARATARVAISEADPIRVLVLAPAHETWVRSELAGTGLRTQFVQSVHEVVAALIETPPPRPQILIVDFSALSAGELLHLHSIRVRGWFGSIIAVGRAAVSLRASLGIERTVTVGPYRLRPIAALEGQHTVHTLRLPKISG
jgi:hypothetical protein